MITKDNFPEQNSTKYFGLISTDPYISGCYKMIHINESQFDKFEFVEMRGKLPVVKQIFND